MIDADVLLGHYPFRAFPYPSQDPERIKAYLQERGIERACLSSLHAAFYTEPQQGNAEALPLVVGDEFFLPVGTINPSLHNWLETFARCVDDYGCRMVRLLPNYHMYSLAEPFVDAMLDAAQARGVVVAIVKRLEDERMHHLLMKVPGVANDEIAALVRRHPQPMVVLSAYLTEIKALATTTENLYFDLAFAETFNTMPRLTETVTPARLLFSTHTPFFYAEGAIGKLTQWQTSAANREHVGSGNLIRLLAK
ncbi:MAG: amidohydrolase family protein [Caldilineaceae bacterium]